MSGNSVDVFEQNRRVGRGPNIIGYDPLWRPGAEARMQDRHFRLIKEAGFQSVRIPLHPWRDLPAGEGGVIGSHWMKKLDWAVEQVLANDLTGILDFHEFGTMGHEPVANHERYLETWRVLAPHCKDLPNTMLFELLNEPSRELGPELWNEYLAEAHAIVRETNSDRTLIIGPAFFNGIDHLEELKLPEDDRNIIVTVHYYKPGEFTHQGAPWGRNRDKIGVEWTASPDELGIIREDFDRANTWALREGRPLYLGEFGVYDKAPMDARVCWTNAVAREAEARGWSWGYWQFDSDFVLWDMEKDQWVQPLLEALVPPQE
jgi:endoglucanase